MIHIYLFIVCVFIKQQRRKRIDTVAYIEINIDRITFNYANSGTESSNYIQVAR